MTFQLMCTFVTEDASPVEITDALPGGAVTGAVFAAWIWDALVTKWTLPAETASGKKEKSDHQIKHHAA